MDIVPESEFVYGVEGDEIVIRDGTHTVKFVITSDSGDGTLRLKGSKKYRQMTVRQSLRTHPREKICMECDK
jgi:hypothetical protein